MSDFLSENYWLRMLSDFPGAFWEKEFMTLKGNCSHLLKVALVISSHYSDVHDSIPVYLSVIVHDSKLLKYLTQNIY